MKKTRVRIAGRETQKTMNEGQWRPLAAMGSPESVEECFPKR